MEDIAILSHEEMVRPDPDTLGALYSDMGEVAAEGVICRAMEELANRLSAVERAYYANDTGQLAKLSKGLSGIASQVGLTKLAACSQDVFELSLRHDPVALAATVARLVRLGDRSMTAFWDTEGMRI